VTAFCERHPEFTRQQISRLIAGERGGSISAKLAFALSRATDGAVPADCWIREAS
jgi:hypothetical protein